MKTQRHFSTSMLGLCAIALSLAACAPTAPEEQGGADTTADASDPKTFAMAVLSGTDGAEIGSVSLIENVEGASIEVTATGLSGSHGFHIHQTGDCSAEDFTSAGGHLNPQDKEHGSQNPAGKHLGDMPNLESDENGTATASLQLEYDVALLKAWVFDDDGAAIVIHAGPDDYQSDPAGDAGPRIACGVLSSA